MIAFFQKYIKAMTKTEKTIKTTVEGKWRMPNYTCNQLQCQPR